MPDLNESVSFNFEEVAGSANYKKLVELDRVFFIEHKRDYFRLISDGAANVVWRQAKYFLADVLKHQCEIYKVLDPITQKNIDSCKESLEWLFSRFVTDGYFAWIANVVLSGTKINLSKAPNSQNFENECLNVMSDVYTEYGKCLTGESVGGYLISKEASLILLTYTMRQLVSFYDIGKDLHKLSKIYEQLQATCFVAVTRGYGIAIADSKYR